ncbi:MAG: radical SAM protein [bacterium]
MSSKNPRYVFGPVPSRRLGRSLGVDLVPYKTCSYDCIYCQLGRTTNKTVQRDEYLPADEIIRQVESYLHEHDNPDVVTLSGSGEPTLHSRAGRIIQSIKKVTDVPVVVLTNGGMLYQPEVAEVLHEADIVIPNLDAGTPELYQAINRPAAEIEFETMVRGLESFSRDFRGRLSLEVFLLGGMNALSGEVGKIAAIVRDCGIREVELNTVTRPPSEEFAMSVSREKMEELAGIFDPPARVIADFRTKFDVPATPSVSEEEVLELLARRPCTLDDVSGGLNIHRNEARKYLEALEARRMITTSRQGSLVYYERSADHK